MIRRGVVVALAVGLVATPAWATERLFVLGDDAARALAPEVRALLRPTPGQRAGEQAFVGGDEAAAALGEARVPLVLTREGVPFAWRDPSYFERLARARQTRGRAGFGEGLEDDDMAGAHLAALAARYPRQAHLEVLGHSAQGRPLLALRIASDVADRRRPTILVAAAEHASEPATPAFAFDVAHWLLEGGAGDPRARAWLRAFTVTVVPMVNSDGSHAFWWESTDLGRKNRNARGGELTATTGVDLNRNFPFRWGSVEAAYDSSDPASNFYRGPAPGSEPEVQAMMRLADRERFVGALIFHANAAKVLVPYTIPDVDSPEPSAPWAVARALAPRLTHPFKRRRYVPITALYPVDGTGQDWYYHEHGTAAFLVETPYSAPTRMAELTEAIVYTRPIWQGVLDRWLEGPSLWVRVRALDTGEPVEAVVTLDEVTLRAGERWRSRPDTGQYGTYLAKPGRYTVHARAGDRHAMAVVDVPAGVRRVELVL